MVSVFSRIDNWKRDLTTNHARLTDDAADEQLRPPLVRGIPAEVAGRIAAWVESQARWSLVNQKTLDEGLEMNLIRVTPIMRFTDDITVILRNEKEGTRVKATSQSRVGKGDLGQNPRNLKELVNFLLQSGQIVDPNARVASRTGINGRE